MLSCYDLNCFPLFDGVDEHALSLLARYADFKRFRAGETIFTEGEKTGALCLIKEGSVKVSRLIRGGESQNLGILEKGMYVGAVSLIDEKAHSASVIAVNDVVTVQIDCQGFRELAQTDPAAATKIMRAITASLCSYLRKMDAKFIDMVQYVAQAK
ncbi:MAG: cyclic nucleotide-binding domain-containing protein [Candidatus Schekmanbacteria bacterium]|nr:cyclic nucleotide-binding domain-containing protein [Candidatus Schekmanbacteria bacterium]